jgi:hypothetical protein
LNVEPRVFDSCCRNYLLQTNQSQKRLNRKRPCIEARQTKRRSFYVDVVESCMLLMLASFFGKRKVKDKATFLPTIDTGESNFFCQTCFKAVCDYPLNVYSIKSFLACLSSHENGMVLGLLFCRKKWDCRPKKRCRKNESSDLIVLGLLRCGQYRVVNSRTDKHYIEEYGILGCFFNLPYRSCEQLFIRATLTYRYM